MYKFLQKSNLNANRPWQPSWISNHSEKIQHFFRAPEETRVLILLAGYAMVLKK
jgi:hypothetical protein